MSVDQNYASIEDLHRLHIQAAPPRPTLAELPTASTPIFPHVYAAQLTLGAGAGAGAGAAGDGLGERGCRKALVEGDRDEGGEKELSHPPRPDSTAAGVGGARANWGVVTSTHGLAREGLCRKREAGSWGRGGRALAHTHALPS